VWEKGNCVTTPAFSQPRNGADLMADQWQCSTPQTITCMTTTKVATHLLSKEIGTEKGLGAEHLFTKATNDSSQGFPNRACHSNLGLSSSQRVSELQS
jgi:hypothetical protein